MSKPSDLIYANVTYVNTSNAEPAPTAKSPSDLAIIIIVVSLSCTVSTIMIALSIYWCLLARKKIVEITKSEDLPPKRKSEI